ncbi:glycosyl transferase [Chryseobacterium formosense]|uniref:Glycosyl transferase n=2 Tax=Chryseobacterium formosense TaxID=236814 RepID=A0A085Z2L5_9FLAO|nr:glycosyltransferase family 8 protein [Chryseobacterium formosense]KFE98678.1 glycosyl transferase [Chryseobacterium formosense]SFT56248.1 Lipopolysaccharide biosynthesis protein, LPS:glycosyltransferase [Chryseobacterium formosense]
MMNFLPIVFTCDDFYFKYTSVVIASLLVNQNKNCQYEINIISEYISNENKALAEKQISKFSNFSIKFIILEDFDAGKFYLNSYMTVSTYYRFYIPQLFKNYKRILYLDSDLIVDADISELAVMDFDDKLAICSPSPFIVDKVKAGNDEVFTREYFQEYLKMPDPTLYFNAGVMLYNLKKMHEIEITEKFFNAIEEIKKPLLQDQDILNSVLSRNGGVKMVSSKYNMTKAYTITSKRIFLENLKELFGISKKDNWFYIYHYVGKEKPWMEKRIDGLLFEKYAKKSPFYSLIFPK